MIDSSADNYSREDIKGQQSHTLRATFWADHESCSSNQTGPNAVVIDVSGPCQEVIRSQPVNTGRFPQHLANVHSQASFKSKLRPCILVGIFNIL